MPKDADVRIQNPFNDTAESDEEEMARDVLPVHMKDFANPIHESRSSRSSQSSRSSRSSQRNSLSAELSDLSVSLDGRSVDEGLESSKKAKLDFQTISNLEDELKASEERTKELGLRIRKLRSGTEDRKLI